ncbi:hypothetical protein TNCV_4344091 [Trichonephila clavipes]|nr:hypothetical protein TNCV_4344091 [Trichonephila clavipes]
MTLSRKTRLSKLPQHAKSRTLSLYILVLLREAQWLSDSVSLFNATGPGFKDRAGQGRLCLSSHRREDK